jgi:hypothetical protein
MQQPLAGWRRTSTKGGNRGKYRCALWLAPVYGDLSSHSIAVHTDQVKLADDDIIPATLFELNEQDFTLPLRPNSECFTLQYNAPPHRCWPMAD